MALLEDVIVVQLAKDLSITWRTKPIHHRVYTRHCLEPVQSSVSSGYVRPRIV
jgi:hypothetical protein